MAAFQLFLVQAAFCAIVALGKPVTPPPATLQQVKLGANNISNSVPTGQYYGSISLQPYATSSSGYTCTSCTISTNADMFFVPNSMTLNITHNKNSQCSVYDQGYYFYNFQDHSGGAYPNYYVAQLNVERTVIPVCMYFDLNHLIVVLDGAGTCPTTNAQPSCTTGWQTGTVSQTWVGSFTTSVLPYGTWSGAVSIVPYTKSATGYACTTCPAITSSSYFTWNSDSFTLKITGGTKNGCTLYPQTYTVTQVVDYGSQYPNYYRGSITIEGAQLAICFYWDQLGTIRFLFDDQGTCPTATSTASCSAGWQPNTVSQVWSAYASPNKGVVV
eukprot:m.35488 g.35488  ORF g.35488 m.35488 type:complete len:329 (+) comp12396_c0_seq1:30-1016(+)